MKASQRVFSTPNDALFNPYWYRSNDVMINSNSVDLRMLSSIAGIGAWAKRMHEQASGRVFRQHSGSS